MTTLRPAQVPATTAAAGPAASWWDRRVEDRCQQVRATGRWRAPVAFDALGPSGTLAPEGTPVVAFASNDYLGLSHHPQVLEGARRALERWGAGAGASRFVTGSRPIHHELERALAAHAAAEAAVVLPTGFATNLAVLTTFGEAGTVIYSDELNHASIVDGARLARADVAVYRHGDVDHLRSLLQATDRPAIVVTDTVFSMDGDHAPLEALVECCRRSGALLVLDEAHAVLGPDPTPLLDGLPWVRVGTLSKTLGSLGGYAASSRRYVELLVNQARSAIFTTALSPAAAGAALAALQVLHSDDGERRRAHLRHLAQRLTEHLAGLGQRPSAAVSPIVPVIIGADAAAVEASARLRSHGFWVPAIRPPTVPVGTARLRVTLSADHSEADVDRLGAALAAVLAEVAGPGAVDAGAATGRGAVGRGPSTGRGAVGRGPSTGPGGVERGPSTGPGGVGRGPSTGPAGSSGPRPPAGSGER